MKDAQLWGALSTQEVEKHIFDSSMTFSYVIYKNSKIYIANSTFSGTSATASPEDVHSYTATHIEAIP